LLLLLLGVVGGLVTWLICPWLAHAALKVPLGLQAETLRSFEVLAASIPVVTVTSGLRGILEAQQRFRILNFIRIPTGAFSFAGPLLVLPFSHSLIAVIVVLILGRVIGCAAHLLACLHSMPVLRRSFALERAVVGPLVQFGGWMTVTNIVGPLMTYLDRFLVGAVLSVSAVAYYTAPFDLVARLSFIPQAIAGVLFPAFAVSLVQDTDRTVLLISRGVKYIFLAMFPIVLITVALAPEGLRLWLGQSFAQNSESVLRWLAAGVFANSLASVPFALIQGAGRPSTTAKLHLLELPLYMVVVWLLTNRLGIAGAAIAWTGRVIVDMVLLFFFAHRALRHRTRFLPTLATAVVAALLALYCVTLPQSLVLRAALTLLILLVFGVISWFRGVAPDERKLILRFRGAKPMKV
jgi:O-antigen/teichoic acid export membrane protein